jgi:ABC-type Fe3+-hydroxamate transport system substrate-binding protein
MPVVFSRRALLAGIVASVVTIACHDAPRAAPVELRDDFENPVILGRAPTRIVSLNPTTTEILFTIGAGARVVGRTHYDLFPDSAVRVPDLGPGIRPNVEAVLGAKPDLVILYASIDNKPAADRLRQAGVAVAAFKIDRIEQFERITRLLGRITGDSARAATVVDSVQRTLNFVRAATASLPRPTVFIHGWDKPVIALTGGSFMTQLLEIAGGHNIYDSIPGPSSTVTLEDLIRRDPQYVLAHPTEADRMRQSPTWRALRAVREGRILVYDSNLVARPSVQLGMAARSFAELLHPGAVHDPR